jgi:type IV pilus assembly protein PilW
MSALRKRRYAAGMSMIELMVAMAISLIGTIIIFQVFEVSEGIRRTTTSGGDAQQNGVIGLYVIENDLRNAGMGFNDTSYAGCNAVAYDALRPTATTYSIPMVPVSITGGAAATTPDALSIFYGSQYLVADSTTITAATSGVNNVKIIATGRYGYRTGDMLLLYQPGTTVCELMEVTALPLLPASSVGDEIVHLQTAYNLDWVAGGSVGTTSRFNPSAGAQAFSGTGVSATRVFNIGNPYDAKGTFAPNGPTTPVYNTYRINANTLTSTSLFWNTEQSIADNVVHMRALYGLDDGGNNGTVTYNATYAAGDGIVDRYVDAATFNTLPAATRYQYLAAVRVVLVARSALPEKPAAGAGAPCDTTTAYPTWVGTAWAGSPQNFRTQLDLSADADWMCYRYKTFETTIPLRNWLWKSS